MRFVLFLLSFPVIGSIQLIAQVQFDSAIEQQIDSLFVEYENEAGAAAAIVHKGEVLYQKGFGLSNMENSVHVTPQTVFETGCVAMNFTATAILLLENQGKLNLDDPIRKYLTTFPNYEKGEVTIRHCLHHTSGFRDYLNLLEMTQRSLHTNFDNQAAFELLKNQKELSIVPGSDYRYSHSNYLVLALVIEAIADMSIGQFAKQELFDPLGMNNTFFYEDNEKVIENRALIYGKEDGEFKLKQNFDFTAAGDGRLYTTVEDMTKWMANFHSSKLGDDEQFMSKLFSRGVLNDGREIPYALGLEYADVNGREEIGHTGWFSGATAMFLMVPDEDLSVITVGNNMDRSTLWKAVEINALLFNDDGVGMQKDTDTEPRVNVSKKEKKQLCGSYFSDAFGYDYTIYLKDNDLYFHDGEYDDAFLKPIGENLFRLISGSNSTTIKFGREGDKRTIALQFGTRTPIELKEFEPTEIPDNHLQQFIGEYYSGELDLSYNIQIVDRELELRLQEEIIAKYNPLMLDVFNSDHDGYLRFETGTNGDINGFSINDYSLGSLGFVKQ